MNSNLVKISTYAKEQGISTAAVYKQITKGVVKCVEIDGVKFIQK